MATGRVSISADGHHLQWEQVRPLAVNPDITLTEGCHYMVLHLSSSREEQKR